MNSLLLPILIFIFGVGISLGFFLLLNPSRAIEMQRRFYEKINWRIEPLSIQKEIRNTKIMGLFLIIFILLAIIYFFIRIF